MIPNRNSEVRSFWVLIIFINTVANRMSCTLSKIRMIKKTQRFLFKSLKNTLKIDKVNKVLELLETEFKYLSAVF